jgi:hypothetical protein
MMEGKYPSERETNNDPRRPERQMASGFVIEKVYRGGLSTYHRMSKHRNDVSQYEVITGFGCGLPDSRAK